MMQRKGQPVRIPVPTTLKVEDFAGGGISIAMSQVINGIIDKRSDGKPYVTQRPSINIEIDASNESITLPRGRGVFYSAVIGALYYVVGNLLFKDDYSGVCSPTSTRLSQGTEPVYFFECGQYLLIVDPENNQAFYIDGSGTTTNYTLINDADFPSTLAYGGASVSGRAYVMDDDGVIYGSDLLDVTSWNPLNFVEAEYQPDGGVALIQQGQQVLAMGDRTVQFFYPNGNTAGNTLSPRTDYVIDVGAANRPCQWNESGTVFMLGQARSGEIGVYMFTDMQPKKVSTTDIDSLLTAAIQKDEKKAVACAISVGGRIYYILTLYNLTNYEYTGTDDTSTAAAFLTDSTAVFPVDGLIGLTVENLTNGESATITDNDETTITGTLSGGETWDSGDSYRVLMTKVSPITTFVYNAAANTWSTWELAHSDVGLTDCPVMGWTDSTNTRIGNGILPNGDVISMNDDLNPQDTTLSLGVFADGVFEDGVFAKSGAEGDAIPMTVILGQNDFGTKNRKICHSIRSVNTGTASSQTLGVQWSDRVNNNYTTARNIDLSIDGQRIARCGAFRQRNHKLTYSGTEQVELEELELQLEVLNS